MAIKQVITIDARLQPMGRLASRVATILMGKHSVQVQKHLVHDVRVVVKNCSLVKLDKRKFQQKMYYRTSGHPGGLKAQPMGEVFQKDPSDVLRRTVAGMLPKNTLREKRLKNLELHNND